MEKPYRTHHTELTEDELLIADMLATLGPVWYGALPQRAYQFHMNLRYTHGVSDDDLPKMLDQMEIDGLLKSSPQSVHPPQFQYQLTIKGGDLWEAERLPIWQR
ncbi:MAG: hypothetical protein O2955_16515 [Planctomycetota bacterium]|nr:hypothetical protein [Planctomycetota bacterium]MDA1214117.1 hypothetical protein [Planctomycetota bacterium]